MAAASILNDSRAELREMIKNNELFDIDVSVRVKALTPEEAIGNPGRRDFPIIIGKERVIEAELLGSRAHAFTDSPGEFTGKLKNIVDLPLESNRERAIYIATLNALLKHLGLIKNTLHCKDDEPEKCAKEISSHMLNRWGKIKVGFIGLNPAIAERLVETFGSENVNITDLDERNIGSLKFGVEIWDGKTMTEQIIERSDTSLITGTTLVNGTFDNIMKYVHSNGKEYLVYGVTGAGICKLAGLNTICPFGREQ
ncbi:MAG: hypothetical protein KAX38_06930 [Candidatus Krumholzibacteria bacterium]|nr:hypothetical protein [Candidatus Krumholzibacteria bacterium]